VISTKKIHRYPFCCCNRSLLRPESLSIILRYYLLLVAIHRRHSPSDREACEPTMLCWFF
jgi:hypothetical protein